MENWTESWVLEKRLDPNWRDRLVLLRLAKAQRLTHEPILVKLPVALHYLHVAEVRRPLVTNYRHQEGCLLE